MKTAFFWCAGRYVKCPDLAVKSTTEKRRKRSSTVYWAERSMTIESDLPVWMAQVNRKSSRSSDCFSDPYLSFSDAATIIVVNLYIRSFAKIDDVKMVSTLMQLFLIRVYGSTYVLCASSNSINAARNLKWAMQRDQPSVMRRGPLRNSLDI